MLFFVTIKVIQKTTKGDSRMDLTAYYYKEIVGVYDFPTLREEAITRHTLAHLYDSGFSEPEIFSIINEIGGKKGYIEPSDLPDSIWKESLTQKGHYYCHHALQIVPPDPIVLKDGTFKEYPFYQEMRSRFTMQDLLKYFYLRNYCITDEARDKAQFKHLLKKYEAVDGIESLDIVLFMIDETAYQHISVVEPFGIATGSVQQEIISRLQKILAERHAKGYDKNIWRTYLIDKQGEITWQI